ncbi:hypothetical protein F4678DRAFT_99541 [Xylaria arbuscula]|nr:hypothetical protein F4678DRAFT_99541 [Xylaria arbuscula]
MGMLITKLSVCLSVCLRYNTGRPAVVLDHGGKARCFYIILRCFSVMHYVLIYQSNSPKAKDGFDEKKTLIPFLDYLHT